MVKKKKPTAGGQSAGSSGNTGAESPKKSQTAKSREVERRPFFKNRSNLIAIGLLVATVAFLLLYRWNSDNLTGAERIANTVNRGVQRVTEGCEKPSDAEVEAWYKDKAGSIPIDPGFDADPGEICGNGKTMFCTSLPPDKPVPMSWNKPPRPGSDPDYEGPSPFDVFKESPHAMPSSKAILTRKEIVDLDDRDLASAVEDALSRGPGGRIGIFDPKDLSSALRGIQSRIVRVDPSLFKTSDDRALSEKLSSMGIDYVLVDRRSPYPAPWMENDMSTIALRMRDAVSMHYFQSLVLGSRYALYARTEPFEIPRHIKQQMMARARATLSGQTPSTVDFNLPLSRTGADEHRVLVSLRKRSEAEYKGRKLARRMGQGATLTIALDTAVAQIAADWKSISADVRREYGVSPGDNAKAAIDSMEIEIDVLYEQCHLTDRRAENLLWYLELGLEGLSLEARAGKGEPKVLEPGYALHMEIEKEEVFLERLLSKSGIEEFLKPAPNAKIAKKREKVLDQAAFAADEKYDFRRFRTVNWLERPKAMNREIVETYRGVPLKTIWDVSRQSLINSLVTGAGWLMHNQSDDGQYAYKYTPMNKPGKRWMEGGNIVRHALNPYTLLMVNKLKQDPEFVKSAKRGIDFSLKFLRHEGNRCVICHRDPPGRYYNAKLNAVAVTILSILKLGDVADISEYKDALRCMAEEMLFMQDKNGHFWQYDVPPDHPYYGAESTIHAGEFIFVLARLYSYYKEERFKVSCDKAIDFYMKQWDRLRSEKTKGGIYDEEHRVNLIGIVPWLVTAMEDLHRFTKDKKYADLAFKTQDWIDEAFFWWQERAQYPDYVGSSFKVHKELPAVNSCQYAEGASAAYAISLRTGRNVEKRRQLVIHSMRYCLQLQFDSYDNTFFLPVPEEAMGGYRYTLGHSRLRNDYNYHAMAAIAQAAEYLRPEDYPAERPLRILPVLRELLGGRENPAKDMTIEEYQAMKAAAPAPVAQP